jgi:hypothetical protein
MKEQFYSLWVRIALLYKNYKSVKVYCKILHQLLQPEPTNNVNDDGDDGDGGGGGDDDDDDDDYDNDIMSYYFVFNN